MSIAGSNWTRNEGRDGVHAEARGNKTLFKMLPCFDCVWKKLMSNLNPKKPKKKNWRRKTEFSNKNLPGWGENPPSLGTNCCGTPRIFFEIFTDHLEANYSFFNFGGAEFLLSTNHIFSERIERALLGHGEGVGG